MQTLAAHLIGNTIVALGLALVAWLCGRWGRPAMAHVIWLLVLVKLVTPPVWRVEVIEAAPVQRAQRVAPAAMPAGPVVVAPAPAKAQAAEPVAIDSSTLPSAPALVSASYPRVTGLQILLAIWLAGALSILLLSTYRVIQFARMLRRRAAPVDDELLDEVRRLANRIDLTRLPRVDVVDAVISPMLWFVGGRVGLILPRELLERMTQHQRAGVIAHELAHLKRRDHWVRLLELPVTALAWWHPLVWVARRGLREAEEQCCDAWAVSVVPDGRRGYADALVDALEMIGRPALPVGATGLGQLGSLQRRLAMIVTQSPPKSVSFTGRVLLAVLLATVAIAPVRGQAPEAAPQPGEPLPATAAAEPVDDNTRQAVLALLEAAQDRDPNVSQAAHAALSQFGPSAIPVLVEALKDARNAPLAMGLIAQRPQATDALLGALESGDADVRARALQALDQMIMPGQMGFGSMGAFADPAMMEDPAMMGMAAADPTSAMADLVPRLIGPVSKAAKDDEANVRAAAVQLLMKIAVVKPDASLVDPLVAAVKDPSIDVRRAAAMGLGRLGPMAAGAVDALAAAVGDRDIALRVSALEALASMGPNAKGAMGTVVAALKAPEPEIRSAAARALGSMHAQPTPPAMPGMPVEGFAPGAAPATQMPRIDNDPAMMAEPTAAPRNRRTPGR